MSLTFSSSFPVGATAPDFSLPDVVSGNSYSLSDFNSEKGFILMFICSHCPYVKHYNEALSSFAKSALEQGFKVAAISANDADSFPEDSPEKMKEQALDYNFQFPYLYDETQLVAKAYRAACTPDFYVFDVEFKCVYHGQFDNSRPKNELPVSGNDLKHAINQLVNNKPPILDQKLSSGCNIKWKAGVSPF